MNNVSTNSDFKISENEDGRGGSLKLKRMRANWGECYGCRFDPTASEQALGQICKCPEGRSDIPDNELCTNFGPYPSTTAKYNKKAKR